MKERHEFCDTCPGCRPAILDLRTGEAIPDDSPVMVAVLKAWRERTTYDQRKGYIEVTLHKSLDPKYQKLASEAFSILADAMKHKE